MKIEFICKNYRLTNRLQDVITAKLSRLDKYFADDVTAARVVLRSDNGKKNRMEVSINYHNAQVRCEQSGSTMYYIIDEIVPKLERQIVKHRGRLSDRYKMPAIAPQVVQEVVKEEEEMPFRIAKIKKFPISSLDVKEAIEELELVGHDFYIFVNSATGNVEAVYRRHDGTVGLLQPYTE